MTTRKELIEALRLRYSSAEYRDRIKILDEFVALTCYHRKHAIRVLRSGEPDVPDLVGDHCVDAGLEGPMRRLHDEIGMRAHVGSDADSGRVHTVVGTAANVNDVTRGHGLPHCDESTVSADAGRLGR